MRSFLLTALLPLALAASSGHGHNGAHNDAVCKAPDQTYSTFCCHGVLHGPSVTAGNGSSPATALSSLESAVSSLSVHVPIPVRTTGSSLDERGEPSAVVSKTSGHHDGDQTSLAPGVTCKGTVMTMGNNGTGAATTSSPSSAAATTTPAGSASGIGGGPSTAAPTSASASPSPSKGAAAPKNNDGLWALGAGLGLGLGMAML